MKRLSHSQRELAVRMYLNGSTQSTIAHAIQVSASTVRMALLDYCAQTLTPYRTQRLHAEIDPAPNDLVHVCGVAGYPGFDLLPEEAEILHEVRSQNGFYALHPEFFVEVNW